MRYNADRFFWLQGNSISKLDFALANDRRDKEG
jgi:hypothetical protein